MGRRRMNAQIRTIIEQMWDDPRQTMVCAPRTVTQQVLQAMLTERTPSNLVDSGGYYGYNWQHNQKVNFTEQSLAWINAWTGPVLSVYWFLVEYLDFAPGLTDQFYAFSANSKKSYLEDAKDFAEILAEYQQSDTPYTWYSYNHENFLSQDIHVTELDECVILSLHGGCDARWGFTRPVIFWKSSDEFAYNMDRITVYCSHCNCGWDFYDAAGSEVQPYNTETECPVFGMAEDTPVCPNCGGELVADPLDY